jgi:[ribosomal protein S5]-alanine N-acetyltransferase
MDIETKSLRLSLQSLEQVRASIAQMPPEVMAQVSPEWLKIVASTNQPDPWIHGFAVKHRTTGRNVGSCGFKGPPSDGVVEIAYSTETEYRGQGYATEMAGALVNFAFAYEAVRVIRAHTLPEPNASGRVLTKCGFEKLGEVIDPEDGLVWRWERPR